MANIGAERLATQSDALNKCKMDKEQKAVALNNLTSMDGLDFYIKNFAFKVNYVVGILEQANTGYNDQQLAALTTRLNELAACLELVGKAGITERTREAWQYVIGLEVK